VLAASGSVTKPTVALNYPEQRGALPSKMLAAGLSVEDEAKQVAEWAAREHPHGRALLLTGNAAWAQRAAGAYEARWSQLGHTSQRFAVASTGGRVATISIDELKTRLEIDPPEVLFAALDVAELRQVRAVIGTAIPCYGGSSINPGSKPGMVVAELEGVRILDLPWLLKPDHPSVIQYPRPLDAEQALDMDRLYALGIDAFRLARALALNPDTPVEVDGVTGQLAAGGGGTQLRRREAAAVYRDGGFDAVDGER
jgi:outer membrane PBP1 activator LpoA protein